MARNLSRADISRAANRAESMRARLANLKKRTEKVAERAVHTVEVGVTAFGFGVLQGKTGGIQIVGVPLELGVGVAAHLAGFLGLGGKMSSHLHGVGDGALAAYLTTTGIGVGAAWKQKEGSGTGVLESKAGAAALGRGAEAFSDADFAKAVQEAAAVGG